MRKASSLLALFSVAALSACGGGQANPPPMPTKAQSQGQTSAARAVQSHAKATSGSYSLFGNAALVSPGNASPTAAQAASTSNYPDPNYFGGVDFGLPAATTFSQITNLSTDYKFSTGSCGGGSPRFSVFVDNGTNSGNINFYIGPPPNFTGCPPNVWTNTGNLASATNVWVDDSQLPGGTFYDSYAAAEAKYGSYAVTDLSLIVDANWFNGPQVVQFDNTQINNTTYTYETGDSCKNGGWKLFTASPGPFKNQGDCVSYFATGGKNRSGG